VASGRFWVACRHTYGRGIGFELAMDPAGTILGPLLSLGLVAGLRLPNIQSCVIE
jgi:hypothetical protein